MDRDKSQQTVFFVLITILIFVVARWWWKNSYRICNENYSPFRNTGGIDSDHTGYTYLDEYSNQQFYKNNPWVYPTPTSYTRLLYKYERENNRYLEEQRKKILDNLKNLPQ